MWRTTLVALLLCISISDALWRRVANRWSAALTSLAGCFWLAHQGGPGLAACALGLAGGFAALVVPYTLGLLGAADVKVFAACGAVVGAPLLPKLILYSTLWAGPLSLLYLAIWHHHDVMAMALRTTYVRGALPRARAKGQTLPLVIALSLGVLTTLQGSAPWYL